MAGTTNFALLDKELLVYWTQENRSDFIGLGDWIEARRAHETNFVDILLLDGETFFFYRLKAGTPDQVRKNVREATRRVYASIFTHSIA